MGSTQFGKFEVCIYVSHRRGEVTDEAVLCSTSVEIQHYQFAISSVNHLREEDPASGVVSLPGSLWLMVNTYGIWVGNASSTPFSGLWFIVIGSILLCGIAILVSIFLILRSERKRAAVGRREIQLFLVGYIIVEICEIFTVGGFPLQTNVRLVFTAIHLGAIVATIWVLLLNGVIGYQFVDDGTPLSLGLILLSAIALFVGTGYIALDTAFSWTGHFAPSLQSPNYNLGLYILYQLVPLIFLVVFFFLESWLVLRVLGERKPMLYLFAAVLLFAIGQIFEYAVSVYICSGTSGKIDGALFETLFTLASVVMIWVFWSSITEDDWPTMPVTGGTYT